MDPTESNRIDGSGYTCGSRGHSWADVAPVTVWVEFSDGESRPVRNGHVFGGSRDGLQVGREAVILPFEIAPHSLTITWGPLTPDDTPGAGT